MTSLLQLRPSPSPLPAYLADALPYAYEEAGKVQFKAMPGIRWVADRTAPNSRGFWRGPRDAIEIVAATLESAGVCKLHMPKDWPSRGVPIDVTLPVERLRTYQCEGVGWIRWQLQQSGAALLADEMGLGKTPQAIVAAQGATLVIAPAVVVPHWQSEIAKWAKDPSAFMVTSWTSLHSVMSTKTPKAAGRAAELEGLRRAAACCDRVILDELHCAANPKSQQSDAASRLLKARRVGGSAPFVIGLTGTPMSTRPRDLWHPLELLWPGRFGSWWDFTKRYCNGHFEAITSKDGALVTDGNGDPLRKAWVSDGISRPEELRTRLAHCMLRRTKAQVGAELPPRTRIITDVHLPASARRDLKAATIALDLHAARSGVKSLLEHSEAYKIDAAEALAREVMASGSRPLLLTTRRDSAAELGKRLGVPHVTGEDAASDRRAKIADAPAAAATLYSVETGINLTGFDVIIFVGLDWVPSRILQGEARIHRIGQDRPVTIYFLIAKGTIDEIIKTRVIERLENFSAITGSSGDEKGLAAELAPETEEDLLAAIVAAAQAA